MLAFILRRLGQAMLVIAAMVVIVFFGVNVVGDPVWLLISPEMTQDQIEETRRGLGLDLPIWQQFFVFVGNFLQGDMGRSFVHGESAMHLILSRMPATMELALIAMLMAIFIGCRSASTPASSPTRRSRKPSWPSRSSASRCRPSGSV